MQRRHFLRLVLAAFLACSVSSVQAAPNELRFMVLGDWGKPLSKTQPELPTDGQKRVAEQMARYAEAHKVGSAVQFVTVTGDNFYESGVTGVDDVQWENKFEQVYDKTRLPMPFIAVLGNHDWRQNPSAQIAYAGVQAARGKSTRWQMDGFYFKRSYGSAEAPLADFFYIDTDLWNYKLDKLAAAQLKWLEEGLKTSKASWQIVVAHHPLFTDGEHAKDADLAKLRDILLPLFKKYGVDVMLAGHDHNLQEVINPAYPTKVIVSGGGAEFRARKTNDFGAPFFSARGFAGIVLTPTEMRGEFIDDTGKSLHSWTFAPVAPAP